MYAMLKCKLMYNQSRLYHITILDKAILSAGITKVISKVARTAGSSQQGKARRAPVACSKLNKHKRKK